MWIWPEGENETCLFPPHEIKLTTRLNGLYALHSKIRGFDVFKFTTISYLLTNTSIIFDTWYVWASCDYYFVGDKTET